MISEQRYWNPVLETLPVEKLRALQLKKFKSIFRWAYESIKMMEINVSDVVRLTEPDVTLPLQR
jgi:phenylacetate-CoA ligase